MSISRVSIQSVAYNSYSSAFNISVMKKRIISRRLATAKAGLKIPKFRTNLKLYHGQRITILTFIHGVYPTGDVIIKARVLVIVSENMLCKIPIGTCICNSLGNEDLTEC